MSALPRFSGPNLRRTLDYSRRTGAPLLGCLLNLEAAPSALGGVGLTVDDGLSSVTGLLDVAVVADFALGYSVRQAAQEVRWAVPTIGLSVQLSVELPARGAAWVSTSPAIVHASASLGASSGLVHTSTGISIGHCSALYGVPHRQPVEPLPWELPIADRATSPPLAVEPQSESDETIRMIREAVALAGQEGSWLDSLLSLVAPGSMRGRYTERAFLDSALVANRAGYVQGGILFALGAVSPLEGEVAKPIGGDMKFVRPARADLPLLIETNLESRGRRVEFASSRLYQDDKLVAIGSYVFRL